MSSVLNVLLYPIAIMSTSRPLYGGGSGVCLYFVYEYSFVICWSPLDVFGPHFAVLGTILGLVLGAFGTSWALLGVTLASLWLPWDTVGPFGAPWAPKWSLG